MSMYATARDRNLKVAVNCRHASSMQAAGKQEGKQADRQADRPADRRQQAAKQKGKQAGCR